MEGSKMSPDEQLKELEKKATILFWCAITLSLFAGFIWGWLLKAVIG
jgi:hypothetical protein